MATNTHKGDDFLECSFAVTEEQTNSAGRLHGGAVASVSDLCSNVLVMMITRGRGGSTIDFDINYMSAGQPRDTVTVRVRGMSINYVLWTRVECDTGQKRTNDFLGGKMVGKMRASGARGYTILLCSEDIICGQP